MTFDSLNAWRLGVRAAMEAIMDCHRTVVRSPQGTWGMAQRDGQVAFAMPLTAGSLVLGGLGITALGLLLYALK